MTGTDLVGRTLAGNRIDALIGSGGTGLVYRAMQLSLGRVVAVKVMAPGLASSKSFRQRFYGEAQIMARITHPNVLPLYEAGEVEGLLYISMRYVEGIDMAALIGSEGSLEPGRAVTIIQQLAQALDAAHRLGLVHRDVKPGNVLIDLPSEHVYLADFGVAQAAASTGSITQHLEGTPNYVAPEQITGETIAPSADIYSLGCVFYHALTGAAPFARENPAATLHAQLYDPPPLASNCAAELAPFDAVITKALAKPPEMRFGSAGQFAEAATQAYDSATFPAEASPPRMRKLPPAVETPAPAEPATSSAGGPRPPVPPAPPLLWPPPSPDDWAPGEIQLQPLYRPLRIPLDPDFRYVHEPLVHAGETVPFLGNDRAVNALAERIEHSTGGAFLITGFRGVGKSTVIRRAVEEMRKATTPGSEVLAVYLNVARPTQVDELLFQIVRRLFEVLSDEQVLDSLNPEVKRSLLVAYTRTSLSFKESRSNAARAERRGIRRRRQPAAPRGAGSQAGSLGQTLQRVGYGGVLSGLFGHRCRA